jgi:hypothetical protein
VFVDFAEAATLPCHNLPPADAGVEEDVILSDSRDFS